LRLRRAQVLALSEDGLKVRADVVKTGFFGNEQMSTQDVQIPWHLFLKVLCIVALNSKCTRALNCENLCQAGER
jgi:hypothetical protein